MLPKTGLQQRTLSGFVSRLTPEEWALQQQKKPEVVELLTSPSCQIVRMIPPFRRGPGRPRKLRTLVPMTIDLVESETKETSETALRASGQSQSTPRVGKKRRDWSHPALFVKIHR